MRYSLNSPVAIAKSCATTKGDAKVEDEALAELAGDSWDGSDGHCCGSIVARFQQKAARYQHTCNARLRPPGINALLTFV